MISSIRSLYLCTISWIWNIFVYILRSCIILYQCIARPKFHAKWTWSDRGGFLSHILCLGCSKSYQRLQELLLLACIFYIEWNNVHYKNDNKAFQREGLLSHVSAKGFLIQSLLWKHFPIKTRKFSFLATTPRGLGKE